MSKDQRDEVPEGQVEVTPHDGGEWLLVQIGRGRYTKRFNIRRSEAAQLVEWFTTSEPAF